jgi:hypothetical protein
MAEFVIVVAAAALASASPENSASVPERTPTVVFNTYPNAGTCEDAAARLPLRPGARFVCPPVEPLPGGPAHPY